MNKQYPRYWNTWEGKIVEALVRSNSPVGWEELSTETDLDQYPLNSALSNLFRDQTIHKDNFGNYQIADEEIRQEWQIHLGIATPKELTNNSSAEQKPVMTPQQIATEQQINLENWLIMWKTIKHIEFSLENKHFFLDGMHTDEFTKDMIKFSEKSVLIANPFVNSCYLTEAILEAREKQVEVKIVTRPPANDEYLAKQTECHSNLTKSGTVIKYNNQIHSKIVIVDNLITIVSSMNFYSGSSGGASLEAGMVSIDPKVAKSASEFIIKLLERPESKS
jgi:phosphatidylserine/phosphatidylglycerophosphate/cardiolipin synthase-like enzyme